MPINFPNSPSPNQLYTYDNKTWEWNGTYWEVYSALTGYIMTAYTVGNGYSVISGVSNGNIALKSFSGDGITIIDGGDVLTFVSLDTYVTGATYNNANTITFTNNTGGTFDVTFNTVTGWTVNGNLTVTGNTSLQGLTATTISATTISGGTLYGDGSNLTGVKVTNQLISIFDGLGGVIQTGIGKNYITIPFNGTIIGWTIFSNISGSINIAFYKDTYANFPPTSADNIFATNPNLVSQQKNQATGLTIPVTNGDVIIPEVLSVSGCTNVVVNIQITPS